LSCEGAKQATADGRRLTQMGTRNSHQPIVEKWTDCRIIEGRIMARTPPSLAGGTPTLQAARTE
jgi:hypothetical protein